MTNCGGKEKIGKWSKEHWATMPDEKRKYLLRKRALGGVKVRLEKMKDQEYRKKISEKHRESSINNKTYRNFGDPKLIGEWNGLIQKEWHKNNKELSFEKCKKMRNSYSDKVNERLKTFTLEDIVNNLKMTTDYKDLSNIFNVSVLNIKTKLKDNNYKHLSDLKKEIFGAYRVNHKVISVELLNEKYDTATLTIEKYHNFAINQGIFIKNSGEIDEKASPLAQMEDFFIPVRNGAGSKIDTLPGASNLDQISDVDFFRHKMISALGIPPQYLSIGGDNRQGFDSKSGLSQQDIRFGRTILRIQKAVVSCLYKICYIHLYLKGFGMNDIKSLKLHMTPPNALEESMRLEAMNKRIDSASTAKSTKLFSDKWILKSIMLLSDNEIEEELKQKQVEIAQGIDQEGGGQHTSPDVGEPGGAFDSFSGENEGPQQTPVSGPIGIKEPEEEPGQENASVSYDNSNLITESKNNKYFYKDGLFNSLLNENQFDGLIDLSSTDANKELIQEEKLKAKIHDYVGE
jgi:hypothetical protein